MTSPTHTDDGLSAALGDLAATPLLLVAVDFDGTLSPTVDDPDAARAIPEARAAVVALAALPATRVAVVSGRALASLERVAQLPSDVLLVGSHGAEFRIDGEESGPELTADERDILGHLYRAVSGVAARFEGARVEEKPAGCGLHTRLVAAEDAPKAQAAALEAVAALGTGRISERHGKDILEFTVRIADKGAALRVLRERTGASATLFVGDDVTDEDGFAVLGPDDVGVKVGEGPTAAEYRVHDPKAVAELLADLAHSRERSGSPRR
jgi:trehalose 6-phosphate phosphatase